MKNIALLGIFFLLFSTGCHVGPDYLPPTVEVPEDWKAEEQSATALPPVDQWWEIFDDPQLNELEALAIENSPNLFVALQKVLEARAIAGVSASALYPQLNLNPTYYSVGALIKSLFPSGTIAPPTLPRFFRIHELIYLFPLLLTYEVDLWGKLRGQLASDIYHAEAEEEALRTTWLTLTAEVASTYFNLRALDAQVELLGATVESRRKGFNLNASRNKNGVAAYYDVSNAELQLASTESTYYDNVRQRNNLENALAVLIGVPASEFCFPANPLIGTPPVVPAGIPCSVLTQRPDVAQAEREMASQHALIGVAYASFLPSLKLTDAIGYESPNFKDFMRWRGRFWAIGVSFSQFVFDGGNRCANLEIAWARYQEAVGNYRQTVLVAFQEVEDALNDIEWHAKQANSLEKAVAAAKTTSRLSNDRYRNGVSGYLEVVDSEQQELSIEQTYINVLSQRFQSTINLIKALGGYWGNYGCDCNNYDSDEILNSP